MIGKLLGVLTLVFLLASPGAAQDISMRLGLKGGLNLANITIEPEPLGSTSDFTRYAGGISLAYGVGPNVAADLDLLYVMKGAKLEYRVGSELAGSREREFQLAYLTASPVLRLTLLPGGGGPYVLAGAEFGYLLKASDAWEGAAGSTDLKDDLRPFDVGLNMGAGMQFPLGPTGKTLFVEGHYVLGVQDIWDGDSTGQSTENSWKNREIYLFGGIRL